MSSHWLCVSVKRVCVLNEAELQHHVTSTRGPAACEGPAGGTASLSAERQPIGDTEWYVLNKGRRTQRELTHTHTRPQLFQTATRTLLLCVLLRWRQRRHRSHEKQNKSEQLHLYSSDRIHKSLVGVESVYPNITVLPSFTCPRVLQTFMTSFLLWIIKEVFWRMFFQFHTVEDLNNIHQAP